MPVDCRTTINDRLFGLLEEAMEWIPQVDQGDWRCLARTYDTRSAWVKDCQKALSQLRAEERYNRRPGKRT